MCYVRISGVHKNIIYELRTFSFILFPFHLHLKMRKGKEGRMNRGKTRMGVCHVYPVYFIILSCQSCAVIQSDKSSILLQVKRSPFIFFVGFSSFIKLYIHAYVDTNGNELRIWNQDSQYYKKDIPRKKQNFVSSILNWGSIWRLNLLDVTVI